MSAALRFARRDVRNSRISLRVSIRLTIVDAPTRRGGPSQGHPHRVSQNRSCGAWLEAMGATVMYAAVVGGHERPRVDQGHGHAVKGRRAAALPLVVYVLAAGAFLMGTTAFVIA